MKIAITAALLLCSAWAYGHSGGTDKQGCHIDHSTGLKHCH